MARTISNLELIVGIALIIVGILLPVNWLQVPFITEILGGVFVAAGTTLMAWRRRLVVVGIILNTLGVFLLLVHLFEEAGETADEIVGMVVGILIALGGIFVLVRGFRPKGKTKGATKATA